MLSIAIELLSFPTVLCMDEPTSGLDAATSFEMAKALSELAANHAKTIICTVHQPSASLLDLWNHLILVGFGGIVYEGSISSAADYLHKVGKPVKEELKYNPVDYFVELLSDVEETSRLKKLWAKEQGAVAPQTETDVEASVVSAAVIPRSVQPVWKQTWILTKRHALYTLLNLHGAKVEYDFYLLVFDQALMSSVL